MQACEDPGTGGFKLRLGIAYFFWENRIPCTGIKI